MAEAHPDRKLKITRQYVTSSQHSLSVRPYTNAEQKHHAQVIDRWIQEGDNLQEICDRIEESVLALFSAERLDIYQKDPRRNDLLTIFRSSGGGAVRLTIGLESIAGYVAMTGRAAKLDDVYDQEERATLHPDLEFNDKRDMEEGFLTESVLCLPIKSRETLLGVLELVNKRPYGAFTQMDMQHAGAIAQQLGDKFHYEMKAARSPCDSLIDRNLISPQLLRALEIQSEETLEPLSLLLKRRANISGEDIGASLEEFYMVPFMAYSETIRPNSAMIEQLNPEWLAANRWVPVLGESDEQIILIDDPNDSERLLEAQQLLNMHIYDVRIGLPEDIVRYLGYDPKRYFPTDVGLGELNELEGPSTQADDGFEEQELTAENDSKIINLVNQLIMQAVERDASDIHLHPNLGRSPGYVRFRVDGVCRDFAEIPASIYNSVVARIKIISRLDIAEKRRPQDGKITVTKSGEPLELRVATVPTVGGESVVLRVLSAGEPLPFEKLNFSKRNLGMIENALEHPHGLVLVVGPTGSGKTTTLHGLLGYMNTPERHILTAEDPVEITQPGLQQVQVQPRIGLTFAAALRSFLRADPDIILIGEMRDTETAHAGIEASLTGHLVFSTLHTNSAPETVVRLLDMGLDPINFADALIAIVAQRLVRTICKGCRVPMEASEDDLIRIKHLYGEEQLPELKLKDEAVKLYRGAGCDRCDGTGYKGRTGVHEVLLGTKKVKRAISKKATVGELQDIGLEEGMRSLMQDGVIKILEGQIDLEQLRKVTVE